MPLAPETLFLHGDSAARLRDLPNGAVHACVTSPPYFGLRTYLGVQHSDKLAEIGHEASPREYANRLVGVLREVRRVLRDDGSLWLVIGDGYSSTSTYNAPRNSNGAYGRVGGPVHPNAKIPPGTKPKDLLGIPWTVAFALRDDGWYLREEIIWSKSSCMPESVRDRCTRQHETVLHLTKSPSYYHDWFAVAEPYSSSSVERLSQPTFDRQGGGDKDYALGINANRSARKALENMQEHGGGMRNARSIWEINPEPYEAQLCCACGAYWTGRDYRRLPKDSDNRRLCTCGSTTAWLSHFAVFPTRLVARCLRASLPAGGCCARCGAASARVLSDGEPDAAWQTASGADRSGGYIGTSRDGASAAGAQDASATKARILAGMRKKTTVGWKPTCGCGAVLNQRPLVLDPFSGVGTTALVALRLGADSVGIDLNQDYIRMAESRLRDATAKCLDTDGSRL